MGNGSESGSIENGSVSNHQQAMGESEEFSGELNIAGSLQKDRTSAFA